MKRVKPMNSLSGFLEKFKKIIHEESFSKQAVINVLEKKLPIKLDPDDLKISNSVLYLNVTPLVRQEIQMRKEGLLEALEEDSKVKRITSII